MELCCAGQGCQRARTAVCHPIATGRAPHTHTHAHTQHTLARTSSGMASLQGEEMERPREQDPPERASPLVNTAPPAPAAAPHGLAGGSARPSTAGGCSSCVWTGGGQECRGLQLGGLGAAAGGGGSACWTLTLFVCGCFVCKWMGARARCCHEQPCTGQDSTALHQQPTCHSACHVWMRGCLLLALPRTPGVGGQHQEHACCTQS